MMGDPEGGTQASLLHTEQQDGREAFNMCRMVTWDTDPERGGNFGDQTHNKHTDYHS